MTNRYLLKYRTYDDLLNEVLGDFEQYDQNGMIDGSKLIKVAMKINKRLGSKLLMDKEEILYVEKGHVRLPDSFHKLNLALLCYDYCVTSKVLRGDQREYVEVESKVKPDICPDECFNPCVRYTECGTEYEIIQTTAYETRSYKNLGILRITPSKYTIDGCFNTMIPAEQSGYIKDGFLYTNFDEGQVYISYLGALEDEEGNLLVLDHDLVNEYYEYALKRRILENLYISGEDVSQRISLIEARYKEAKEEGETLINTPDFADLKDFHDDHRKKIYNKYYKIFA